MPSYGVLLKWMSLLAVVSGLWVTDSARAQSCTAPEGTCNSSAECGAESCASDRDCTGLVQCVDRKCRVSCDNAGSPKASGCSLGEACAAGSGESGDHFYCKPVTFAMDLNLLDTCIYHVIEGIPPARGDNSCSLETQLATMMGDGAFPFDIFDLDACIVRFLNEEPCDRETKTCGSNADGLSKGVFCEKESESETCGLGSHCNTTLSRCERQCGMVPGPDGSIDRPCAGNLQVCDYERGRCKTVKLGNGEACAKDAECVDGGQCMGGSCQTSCNIDLDCPSGAYCLLGQCQSQCFRNLDCADSTWFCGASNRCEPSPVSGGSQAGIDPQSYSLRFAVDNVALDTFGDEADVPLVIMNHVTNKRAFGLPQLVFGYRLEARYGVKQSPECRGDLSKLSDAAQAECLIAPEEQFLLLDQPFGRVYGDGDANIPIRIDHDKAALLGTGEYVVTLSAYFSNGGSASVQVRFRKPSQNGSYAGRLSMFAGGPALVGRDGNITNHLGTTSIAADLYVDSTSNVHWEALLKANRLEGDRDFEDLTRGQKVTGYLDANGTFVFANPAARARDANRLPVFGLYSPQLGRMRLLGVIDLPAEYCAAPDGACGLPASTPAADRPLTVRNPFGRRVRRIIQFIGPFDARTGVFSGLYRETIAGLAPDDISVEGGFSLEQREQDDTPIVQGPLLDKLESVSFPENADVLAEIERQINAACPADVVKGVPVAKRVRSWFESDAAFRCYLAIGAAELSPADRLREDLVGTCADYANYGAGRVIPTATRFLGLLSTALDHVGDADKRVLTEAVDSQLLPCDGDAFEGTPKNGCVDTVAVECGLALYRKAVVKGWVSAGAVINEQRAMIHQSVEAQAASAREGAVLFCSDRPGKERNVACPAKSTTAPNLFALQELGTFYREAVGRRAFAGASKLSDAFFLMYRLAGGSASMRQGETFELKRRALREAIAKYDEALTRMLSPSATYVLNAWPASAFQRSSREWIEQMSTVLFDRLDAVAELADLERRLLDKASQERFVITHHALAIDYLAQVLLAKMQARWEGNAFEYVGDASRLFQRGATLLNKLSEGKNPLGLHPNRVYFDNPDSQLTNVENLRARLRRQLDPGNGATTLAAAVDTAITSMEQSTQSEAAFRQSLFDAKRSLAADLDQLCGPENENGLPTQCIDPADKVLEDDCEDESCLFQFRCDGDQCADVKNMFKSASDSMLACRTDQPTFTVRGANGSERPCMRGEVGGLLQERTLLDLQRKQVLRDIQLLLRQVARQQAYVADIRAGNAELISEMRTQADTLRDFDKKLRTVQHNYDAAMTSVEIFKCIIGGATSVGNCGTMAGWVGGALGALKIRDKVSGLLIEAKTHAETASKIRLVKLEHDAAMAQLLFDLDSTVTGVFSHVSQFESVVQQLFNLDVRIADAHFLARRAAERFGESVSWEAERLDRLSGWKSSDVLRRNEAVGTANRAFQRALTTSYELVQAVRYDFNAGEEQILAATDGFGNPLSFNGIYKMTTLQDMQWFLSSVDDLLENRCRLSQQSGQGDCQSEADERTYAVSLQKLLFPSMHDIIDSATNRMLTAGEQFHQRITSSEFLRKRPRGAGYGWQIEIPFGIWPDELARLNADTSDDANVTSGQCNLRIQGGVALRAVGSLLSPNLSTKLFRGGTDYQRSCYAPPGSDPKVESYKIGWLPGLGSEQDGSPFRSFATFQGVTLATPTFVTRFVDRSLAAPDYVLVIELTENAPPENHWLFKVASGGQFPVLQDLELTFKYRAIDFR